MTTPTDFWQNRVGFWNRGGFWKAVLVAAVYLAVYTGVSLLIGVLFGNLIDEGGIFASGKNVLILLLIPIGIGAILIATFLAAIGWLRPILYRQPISGRPWMWIAVAIVVYPIILRLIGIPYSEYRPEVVVLTLLSGLVIGIAEELVARGAAVALLRKHGYRELAVAVLSSAIFAAMHTVNALGTGVNLTIAILVAYTFFFGVCMYLVMRVTGSIVWAIVLHGLTDPTLFLASGGVDTASGAVEQNTLLTLAAPSNFVVIVFGAIALFFIRGRVIDDASRDVRQAGR